MRKFHFDNDLRNFNTDYFLVSVDKKTETEMELLNILYEKFQFPSYFGFNWDALWDVLNDLSWIRQHQILLTHEVMPRLNNKEMSIYINILFDLINNWKEGEIHSFDVFFPKQDEEYIMQFVE